MDKKTKLILSIIGLAAIVVPSVLLLLISSRDTPTPEVSTDRRQIDTKNVQESAARAQSSPTPLPSPSPSPSPTPSLLPEASPSEGTPSGQ